MITVKYFASLRERVGVSEERIEADTILTVADVWARARASELPANTLVAVNQNYARLDSSVANGDEVAFFPPVTGG
ncbi:MAG: molybdopterin converting factor subunit 1 [Thiotrichales bacterium]